MRLTRNIKALTLAVSAALLIVGCGHPNPHEPVDLKKIESTVSVDKVWSFSAGGSVTGLMVPAITETGIYVAGDDDLYRLDAKTGDKVWRVSTQADVTAGVGSDGQIVALGNVNGEVEVYDNTGKFLWKVKLPSEISTPPLVGSGFVIVKTSDTRITAFDALTGERRWRNQTQPPALTVRAASQMKFSQAGVLIGQANGRLLALNGQGEPVFDVVVAQPKGITEIERLVDVVGTPMVDAKMICAAAYQGNLLCLNMQAGQIAWRTPVDAVTGPVSDGKQIYVVNARGEIEAFDYETGKQVWVNKDFHWRSPSAVALADKYLTFGDFDGVIHVLDPLTGKPVGRSSVSGAVRSAPQSMDGGVLLQTDKGKVVFLKVEYTGKSGMFNWF